MEDIEILDILMEVIDILIFNILQVWNMFWPFLVLCILFRFSLLNSIIGQSEPLKHVFSIIFGLLVITLKSVPFQDQSSEIWKEFKIGKKLVVFLVLPWLSLTVIKLQAKHKGLSILVLCLSYNFIW